METHNFFLRAAAKKQIQIDKNTGLGSEKPGRYFLRRQGDIFPFCPAKLTVSGGRRYR